MKKMKLAAQIVALALTVFLLASCDSSESPAAEATTTAAAKTPDAPPENASATTEATAETTATATGATATDATATTAETGREIATDSGSEATVDTEPETTALADVPAPGSESNTAQPHSTNPPTGDYTPPYDDWSDISDDELYQLALQEPVEPIVVYSAAPEFEQIVELFEAEFPCIKLKVEIGEQGQLLSRIKTEVNSGARSADVLLHKDTFGKIKSDYIQQGILEYYYPRDICEQIEAGYLECGLPVFAGMSMFYYSKNTFPDAPPIDNWWDILDQDSEGAQKWTLFMKNPSGDDAIIVVFCMLVNNSDLMEKAYRQKYRQDIEYTYDASRQLGVLEEQAPPNNAGYEFIYRLSQAKVTFIAAGNEISEKVQRSSVPTIGLAPAWNIANSTEENPLAWIQELEPFLFVPEVNYVYAVANTKHQAGARLLMQYVAGSDDSKARGLQPFTGLGAWSVRRDIPDQYNPFHIYDTNAKPADMQKITPIWQLTREFWNFWLAGGVNPPKE